MLWEKKNTTPKITMSSIEDKDYTWILKISMVSWMY